MKHHNLTHSHYRDMLLKLKKSPFELTNVEGYFSRQKKKGRFIILRHDVDRKAYQAVKMAELETSIGVSSTYYFRSSKYGNFPDREMKIISSLGHEVGYHYENLSQFKGNTTDAMRQFRINLDKFREHYKCNTICAHGKPLSKHNNFTQLMGINLAEYGIVADASLSLAKDRLLYFTDTGGRWNIEPALNHRDYIGPPSGMVRSIDPSNAEEFLQFLSTYDGSVYISTHPERWAHSTFFLARATSRDAVINIIKKILKIMRLR